MLARISKKTNLIHNNALTIQIKHLQKRSPTIIQSVHLLTRPCIKKGISTATLGAYLTTTHTTGMSAFPIEWLYGVLGGGVIGGSSVLMLLFHGRIAGISGMLTKIMDSAFYMGRNPTRLASCSQFGFCTGLLGSGIYWNAKYLKYKAETKNVPYHLQPFQQIHYSPYIMALSGLMVGFGTRFGSGCTSGHGVCGLARKSVRSATAVGTFFGFGVASTTLSNMYMQDMYQNNQIRSDNHALVDAYSSPIGMSLVCAALLCGAMYSGRKGIANEKIISLIPSCAAGFGFGSGLIYSGMTKPDKVRSFLNWNVNEFTQHFDPSLAFVFMGALGMTVPLFPMVMRMKQPILSTIWHLPASSSGMIDKRLLIGASIFGTGWGLGGICPGPGFVSLTSTEHAQPFYIWCGAFAIGNRLLMLA